MVRERTPARRQAPPQVSDSWVVESDGDDDYTPPPTMSASTQDQFIRKSRRSAEPAEAPRKRKPARVSAEPEFIMPSIHQNGSVGGSWLGEEKQQPQQSRVKRRDSPQGPDRPNRYVQKVKRRREPTVQDHVETSVEYLLSLAFPILTYIRDIIGIALTSLKAPIGYLLAIYLVIGSFVFFRNLLFTSITSALSPICRVPGVGLLHLPICRSNIPINYNDTDEPPPVRFDRLMQVQDKFDEVLKEAAGGASLPLDMKRGETSIRDLRQLVKHSTLQSRNELVLEFDGFIETARIASFDLQKFNSHVGRGVDNILATARWTKRVLDGIAERDAVRGRLSSFVNDKVLAPFQPVKFNEDMLLDQYLQHTRVVEEEVTRLTEEAQALLMILTNLEDRLDVINGVAIKDDIKARGSKEEVLSQLWTMLGGNRSKLGKFNSQLRLLSQVNAYRQNAIAHVTGTLVKLQAMGADLEELRDRVGGVELLGTRGPVSLRLHIENIEMGVERLEKGRQNARQLESDEREKTLGKDREGAKMIDER